MMPLEELIRDFQINVTDEPATEYVMTGPFELMALMADGTKYLYDKLTETYRFLPRDSHALTDEEIKREFTIRFRKMMKDRRMTQKELSQLTGISEQTISKYTNGTGFPTIVNLDRIAKALKCSADDFRYL